MRLLFISVGFVRHKASIQNLYEKVSETLIGDNVSKVCHHYLKY